MTKQGLIIQKKKSLPPPADEIYGGSRGDIMFRCALLSKAALEAPWIVPCGGAPYGDSNLVFIANDWHTALLPVYLQVCHQPSSASGASLRSCSLLSVSAGILAAIDTW